VRPRLDAVDWPWRVAADPLPAEMDEARERAAWTAAHGRVWSPATLEKVVLVGLICVIYAEVLPGLDASGLSLFLGLAAFVLVNAGLALWAARAARTVESAVAAFALRVALNSALVLVADRLLGRDDGGLNQAGALFFVLLLSLITSLHDRFWPVHQVRSGAPHHPVPTR
jgi:hypothetical protein